MPIRVRVFKRLGRKYYEAQWNDPVSAKKLTRSTKESEHRAAERFAARLEEKLNSELSLVPNKCSWEFFRSKYEAEVAAHLAEKTRLKIISAFRAFERLISPSNLTGITSATIAKFRRLLSNQEKKQIAPSTVKGYLAHLRAAFRWAKRENLISSCPHFEMPKKTAKRGGRAITAEEFDRLLAAIPKLHSPPSDPKQWEFLLRGLWWSGLRLGEAMQLHWTDPRNLCVDFSGPRPMFRIQAHAEKGRKTRILPMAPEFAELLESIPKRSRRGFVFNPMSPGGSGQRASLEIVGRMIRRMGKKAGIRVGESGSGKVKFASAHDLRRAFGDRWAMRVLPPVLMELMRHESIHTTMTHYVGREAQATAEAVWSAMVRIPRAVTNTFANTRPKSGT